MIPLVPPLSNRLDAALRACIDGKTKPLGSLGALEGLALQIGRVCGSLSPRFVDPHILICAGDHGAALEGISAYPRDVTWQMVENFLAGGAAINVLARQAGLSLCVADAGVAHDFGPREGLIDAKIAPGTASWTQGPAMTAAQCAQALENGRRMAADLARGGCNVLGFGEMGIGNTASAALITSALLGVEPARTVGRGTGIDDAGLARKRALVEQALRGCDARHADPLDVMARFGGFEMAMLTGAMLEAASRDMLMLIDGFIVTACLLVAVRLAPPTLDRAIFCHGSAEPGHEVQLAALGSAPLLRLGLRLGEGSGVALAWPLVKAAAAVLDEMASFASAGVSEAS